MSFTLMTLLGPDFDPVLIDGRKCCANGHPWQPKTAKVGCDVYFVFELGFEPFCFASCAESGSIGVGGSS